MKTKKDLRELRYKKQQYTTMTTAEMKNEAFRN